MRQTYVMLALILVIIASVHARKMSRASAALEHEYSTWRSTQIVELTAGNDGAEGDALSVSEHDGVVAAAD